MLLDVARWTPAVREADRGRKEQGAFLLPLVSSSLKLQFMELQFGKCETSLTAPRVGTLVFNESVNLEAFELTKGRTHGCLAGWSLFDEYEDGPRVGKRAEFAVPTTRAPTMCVEPPEGPCTFVTMALALLAVEKLPPVDDELREAVTRTNARHTEQVPEPTPPVREGREPLAVEALWNCGLSRFAADELLLNAHCEQRCGA